MADTQETPEEIEGRDAEEVENHVKQHRIADLSHVTCTADARETPEEIERREAEEFENYVHQHVIADLLHVTCTADAQGTPEEIALREAKELMNYMKQHGIADLEKELRRRLHAWKSTVLNIGVIGASGVGKSSFINNIRKIKPSDPGGAATGVTQTTMKPTPYKHPDNDKVQLWDLPGVGTPDFPKESYLEAIDFKMYDFFVIICCERFTEYDLWFAQQIRKAGKKFYFARTKVDDAVRNDHCDYPGERSENSILQRIRDNCIEELSKANFTDSAVFLLGRNPLLYDLPVLEKTLIADLPELKREAALLTMQGYSESLIKEKSAELQKRSSWLAAISGLVGAVPVPFLSIFVDAAIIIKEIKRYAKVYGLDDNGLQRLSVFAGVPKQVLCDAMKTGFWINLTAKTLLRMIATGGIIAAGVLAADVALKVAPIPVVSSVVCAPTSFILTKRFLTNAINTMEKAALEVYAKAYSEALKRG